MRYRLAEALRLHHLYLVVIGPRKMALVKSERASYRAETKICRRANESESRTEGKRGASISRRRRVHQRQAVPFRVTSRRRPERSSTRHPAPEGEWHIPLGCPRGPGA